MKFIYCIIGLICATVLSWQLGELTKAVNNSKTKEVQVIIIQNKDTTESFKSKTVEEGLKEALAYYGVKHADIVYAQAQHETGHFKSDICVNNNNLFGLYDSANNRYYKYNNWYESVQDYKDKVQYKYNPSKHKTYYNFLEDIGYATDKDYNKKLKKLVAQNKQ